MSEQFSRTELLLGKEAMEKLAKARVAVFGVGGVGGYVCEALVRSGVGAFDLIDKDEVSLSNLNRQIIATMDTVGRSKVEVMKERMLSINPDVKVTCHQKFFLPENADEFNFTDYDYVVDAVDTVAAKIAIVMESGKAGVPVISSMGAGNHLDPTAFRVADIYKTKMCPLAKVMRHELKKRGVKKLKVVYTEEPVVSRAYAQAPDETVSRDKDAAESEKYVKVAPGSVAFVPSVAGLIIAGEVVKDLNGK